MLRFNAHVFLATFGLLAVFAGCRSTQIQSDQDHFRQKLLEMETNQLMDNLVRAKNGLPIVHIDYGDIAGTITQVTSGDLKSGYSDVLGGAFTGNFAGTLAARQDNQLGVKGQPVRNNPDVYLAYLRFIHLPESLLSGPCQPPEGSVHIWRKCGDTYYWVPIERRGDFFELSMRVSPLRGQSILPPEGFPVVIEAVTATFPKVEPGEPILEGTAFELTVQFKKEIPNDSASSKITLTTPLGNTPVVKSVEFTLDDRSGPMTKTLKLTYEFGSNVTEGQILLRPEQVAEQITGKDVTLFYVRYRPKPSTQDELLRDIRSELNSIRLNQLRAL